MKYYVDSYAKLMIGFEKEIKSIYYLDSPLNNIYRGRIQKKIHSIGTFIDLGMYTGFTQEKVTYNEGESILVKVVKVPSEETKALKVSKELSLTGRYMILFDGKFIKMSSKLSKERKEALYNFSTENNFTGVLFRTEAEEASLTAIYDEYVSLKNKMETLLLELNRKPTPKLLYSESLENRMILDKNTEIIFNEKDLYKKYSYIKNTRLDEEFRIEYIKEIVDDLNNLTNKEVNLKEGGSLIFEKTTAFTVIDVNTKNVQGVDNRELNNFVNKNAAIEIVRQIILRNISGAILIDFINVDKKDEKEILNLLNREFQHDGKNTTIHGFTKLGLVEISRKNRGLELNKLWRK